MNQTLLPSWLQAVHHDGSETYVSNPSPELGDRVQVRLRVGLEAPIRRVFLRTAPDGEQAFTLMTPGSVQAPVRWWEGELPINQPYEHYRFVIEAEDGVWWFNAAGPTWYDPLDNADFRLLAGYSTPQWLHEAVFYQIFPDRFANGDPSNDPQPGDFQYQGYHRQTFPWGSLPPSGFPLPLVFYGGDLDGISQNIDYVDQLGANALYLNPVFTAYSNHKYDVIDYEHVDPHFGGNEALVRLRHALSARHMRYILDIVPNHCGYWHPWFQAARREPDAPEVQFFTFRNYPEDYAAWLGVWILPKLNYASRELRRRMYNDESAVFRRWLQHPFSADGWRVDVANMLGRQGASQLGTDVAQGVRHAVKSTKPDAYLLGEHFFDASDQLQGQQWDGVMNYGGFATPLWHWLGGFRQKAWGMSEQIESPEPWPTAALVATWQSRLAAVPWTVAQQCYNLLGSHDTPRIQTRVGGNKALHRLAATLLLTFPGVPGIYYGDEIGMEDVPGLGSRGCMIWQESRWDRDMLRWYQQLIQLRRESHALRHGGFQVLAVETDGLAYQREGTDGRVIVVAQRGESNLPASSLSVAHGGIADGIRFHEHFSGYEVQVQHGKLALPEQPQGATVWREITS